MRPALVYALCVLLCACNSCGPTALATIERYRGTVDTQTASTTTWNSAQTGGALHTGDALRTQAQASAELAFLPDGQMRVEENTIVRFLDTPPDSPQRLELETGDITLETETVPIELTTRHGVARLQKGSRVNVRVEAGRATLEVVVGRVTAQEAHLEVEPGQRLILSVGEVVAESIDDPDPSPANTDTDSSPGEASDGDQPPQAAPDAPTEQVETLAQPAASDVRVLGPAADADFQLGSASKITVHDPTPPTRIRFTHPECATRSQLWLQWGHQEPLLTAPATAHTVALAEGRYSYRLGCESSKSQWTATGRVIIRADAATRRLPRTAPHTELDADGRRYMISYQNRLPSVSFHWPEAPRSSYYELKLYPEDGAPKTASRSKTPRLTLASGALAEGIHRFRMVTAGGRSSPESTVRIHFENVHRTARLSSPEASGYSANADHVIVRGVVLAGTRVQVNGQSVHVASGGRFAWRVAPPPASLVIHITHPLAGDHYYLRRPLRTE